MLKINYLLVILICCVLTAIQAQAASGDLDLTFGANGQVFRLPIETEAAQDAALQADGKIVLASAAIGGDNYADFAVVRLNSNGTLDTTFGTNGRVLISFAAFSGDRATAIAVQTDGKIVVAGNVEIGSPGFDFGAARLNSDGSLDTSFGTGGKVVIPVSSGPDYAADMILQPDGKIIIGGKSRNQPNFDAALVRLNPNGTLDTTFNGSGKIVIPVGAGAANDFIAALALQPDGKIVAAGSDGSDFAVLRFNANGSFDTGFDGDGKAITPIGTQRDEAFAVALQPDGKIIAGGSANSGSGNDAALVRYNSNGSLDNSFGAGGKVTVKVRPTDSEVFKSVIVQTDGKIVGIGTGGDQIFRGDFILVRFNSDGSPDTTFGNGGKIAAKIGNGNSAAYSGLLQPDGKIVIVGVGPDYGIAAARFLTTAAATARSVKFDFDGDFKTDISIYRPAPGEWWYLRSSDSSNRAVRFGSSNDKIVPADYTGDGKTDIAVWRESTGEWFILRSEDGSFYSFPFGAQGDKPAPADFDGDGKADAAVFRSSNSTWYILKSTGGTLITQFGVAEDIPQVNDYDGDGKADLAVFRPTPSQWWIKSSGSDSVRAFGFGQTGDKPVPADYTGDGKTDVAVWRPASGTWFILRSEDNSFYSFPFGISTDQPAPGDYDGDGKADPAVFRNSNTAWYLSQTTNGSSAIGFGSSGDKPVPSAFIP